MTHLLETSCNQSPIASIHPLHGQASTITRPWAALFAEKPIVRPETVGIMEVDGVIQADHHTNFRPHFTVLADHLGFIIDCRFIIFQRFNLLFVILV